MKGKRLLAPLALTLTLLLSACGDTVVFELVDAPTAYAITEDQPDGLVVLDVRTLPEHQEMRIAGSVLIDFYSPGFRGQLDTLDKDVPYLVYCRSGNRSAEAVAMMRDLGFTEVHELDGGIASWAREGLPLVSS